MNSANSQFSRISKPRKTLTTCTNSKSIVVTLSQNSLSSLGISYLQKASSTSLRGGKTSQHMTRLRRCQPPRRFFRRSLPKTSAKRLGSEEIIGRAFSSTKTISSCATHKSMTPKTFSLASYSRLNSKIRSLLRNGRLHIGHSF